MHVLVISDVFFPRVNGVSTSIASFRPEIERLGHRVSLVAPEYPGSVASGERVMRVSSLPCSTRVGTGTWRNASSRAGEEAIASYCRVAPAGCTP